MQTVLIRSARSVCLAITGAILGVALALSLAAVVVAGVGIVDAVHVPPAGAVVAATGVGSRPGPATDPATRVADPRGQGCVVTVIMARSGETVSGVMSERECVDAQFAFRFGPLRSAWEDEGYACVAPASRLQPRWVRCGLVPLDDLSFSVFTGN